MCLPDPYLSVCVWCVRQGKYVCVASLERQGHLFGWKPRVSHTLHGCLLLKDAQTGALCGQGATWLRSQCPAGKHASEPFLSIGQMAALCFVCLILSRDERESLRARERERAPVCAVFKVKSVKKINLATLADLLREAFVRVFYKMGKHRLYILYIHYMKAELGIQSRFQTSKECWISNFKINVHNQKLHKQQKSRQSQNTIPERRTQFKT